MAPHPAARVRTLAELHDAIAGCRMCPRMTPPPILWAQEGHRALIFGQAPGITEPEHGLPFAGAAGRKLITWLAPLGISSHEEMLERFAFGAVAKCYPGRLPGGRGDRTPDRSERENCNPWTDALVRLLDPAVVVPVGRLAIDDWLGPAPLSEVVGRRFEREGRVIVPLPHPSGASAWTNSAANRELVAQAVAQLRDTLL
ncbi:MAG TPA: uracil-DNA glycosylase family protein [Gaiellales bacterium]|jgi:uracil-DNA glycosylase|nr:uracil-DNA glycosylase family protein [Gaiellales bacterium]